MADDITAGIAKAAFLAERENEKIGRHFMVSMMTVVDNGCSEFARRGACYY